MKFYVSKMSRRRSRPIRQPPNTITCCFCGFPEDDEVEYGKLWNHDGIVTHYYCLLLSSNMEQNGNDNQGILGFMPADIQKELRRGKRLSCTYCKRTGATLGCCNSRCKRVFHLPCGLRAGSLHQFFGEFRSYCITHRIKQEIDDHIKQEAAAAGTVTCYICYEEVNPQNTIRTLWAPCCRKNAWFHRKCVQRLALSAGYFFKCPLCNNKQEFQQAMLEHGIFIPNQDASWELVPNAYQELLHRHNSCDAVECLCPKGRSHTGVNAKWELVLCRLCGSQGVHKACGHLKLASSIWECAECVAMLRKNNEAAPQLTNKIIAAINEISEDESSSDSDISVGRNPSPLPETDRPDSPSPLTTPVKLRPGPRSFKLQQAVQNAKSAESTRTGTADTSVPENRDILLSNKSNTDENALTNGSTFSNGKSNGETSQVENFPAEKALLSSKSTSTETNSTISGEESHVSPETENAKLIEPRRREAEIIVIDSDDEVEIISVKPKQNILTTKDGTQIPIHSLSQVAGERQRAEGDVKVAESTHSQLTKASPCQTNVSLVTKSSFTSDTSGLSNTLSPKSAPSNVPESPVTNRNAEDLELMVVSEVQQQTPVMTFKITNVTSLRQEDFTNTIQHSDVIGSDLSLNNDQHLRIMQITNPMNGISKPNTTAFQLSTAAIKDMNVKRKSDDYTDKNLSDSADKKVMESRKRARICDPNNTELVQQRNMSLPWGINFSDVNGVIPILATSMPSTCSSNSSTTTLQTKLTELHTDNKGGLNVIYNPDIHQFSGIYRYPPKTGKTKSSVQKKTRNNKNHVNLPTNNTNHVNLPKDNTNHVNLPNNGPSPIGLRENSLHMSKVTKTYGTIQPHTVNQFAIRNMGGNNTNVNGTAQSIQQFSVDGLKNIPEISSRFVKPQTLTQQIPNSSESAVITSHSVYQSHENVNRESQRFSESGGSLQKNLSATDVIFYNGLPRNQTETPTGSTGNQPSVNNVSKSSHLISQLANGIQISGGCDGDAGSSPAAEAGFAHQAATKSPVHPSTEPISFTDADADATSDTGQSTDDHSSISARVSADSTNVQRNFSFTTTGKYCDKPRLIPENVPLRNLKFRVLDPKIIQIVVHDTYRLNISIDTDNLQNIKDKAGQINSIKKQKLLQSLTQQSNSISSKFGGVELDRTINIHSEHDLSKTKRCSKIIANNPKEFTSPIESLHNFVIPEFKLTDGEIKPSRVLEKGCNIGSYCRIQELNSIREICRTDESLICTCFEVNDRNSCIQHKENISREEIVYPPAFSKNSLNLKNLCERDDNIISIDKSKSSGVKMEESLVKKVKYKNRVRSLSSIDFYSETHDCSNVRNEKKRSIELGRLSKCLVKSLDDFSKLNASMDCYNNYKKIVDRSSEFNCNIDSEGADVKHLLKNNAKNISDLDAVNVSNIISVNSNTAKSKFSDTPNSSELKAQTVCANSMTETSCALRSSENIDIDVSVRKPLNTAVKDRISSLIDENTSSDGESDLGIKVRIDLNKIQHFIDSNPRLFNKQLSNENGMKPSPFLEASRFFHNADSNNCSYFSKTETSRSVQDTDYSHTRKRLKYSSELVEECSNS